MRRTARSTGCGPSTACARSVRRASRSPSVPPVRAPACQHHRSRSYGTFNMPSGPRRDPASGPGHRLPKMNMTFPLGSAYRRRVEAWSKADVNICLYREFGRDAVRGARPPVPASADWAARHDEVPAVKLGELTRSRSGAVHRAREAHDRSSRSGTCGARVTQDFFGTASFAVVATETYTRGIRALPRGRDGAAVHVRRSTRKRRREDRTTTGGSAKLMPRTKPPLVMYRQLQRTHVCWPRAAGTGMMKPTYIPASFPGAIIRPRTPERRSWATPARPTSIQEVLQRAVRRAVPHPAARAPTSTASEATLDGAAGLEADAGQPWDDDAVRRCCTDTGRQAEPMLVRISAAKRLRDQVPSAMRVLPAKRRVTARRVAASRESLASDGAGMTALRRRSIEAAHRLPAA